MRFKRILNNVSPLFYYILITYISVIILCIGCISDNQIKLTNDLYYDPSLKRIFGTNNCDIPPTINKLEQRGDYFIIKQHLLNEQLPEANYCLDINEYRYGLSNDYYWVIDSRKPLRYGPYDFKELMILCDSLGIVLFEESGVSIK